MKKSSAKNVIFLLIASFIWGTAFVAQSVGLDFLTPFAFCFFRFVLGGVVLIPIILILRKKNRSDESASSGNAAARPGMKMLLAGGILCGLCLFGGSAFQQIALQTSSVGKAGFITTLYIVLVPVVGIFLRKKTSPLLWIAVIIAVIGLYLLSIKEGFSIEQGDILLLLCAGCFTAHILVVDYFVKYIDGALLSCLQFFTAAVLSLIFMLPLDGMPPASSVLAAWFPLVYAGVFSCGIAFTFQILGQKDFNPTAASLLMSFESVFSALAGMIILGEALSSRETLGCVLMFAAVILAQIPAGQRRKKKSPEPL